MSQDEAASDVARTRRRERKVLWLCAIGLVCVVSLAYSSSFDGKFIYDDEDSIVANPSFQSSMPLAQRMLSFFDRQRPVVYLTFWVNYQIGVLNPWGYHLVNLAIHAAAAVTLFGLVRRVLTGPVMGDRFARSATLVAVAVAGVWAVHPLTTQSVTYVVQRTESLAALFYLLTLYCMVVSSQSSRPGRWHVAAVLACVLGMGTKQTLVTAPLAALLLDWSLVSGSLRAALRARWGLYLGLAGTWLLVGAMMLLVPTGPTAGFGVKSFTWQTYLITQAGVIAHYLFLTFWPAKLCLDYWWPPQPIGEVWPQAILIVGLLAASVAMLIWRRTRAAGLCGVLFFLILAPTSSFIPIRDAAVEHRMYLPLAAVVCVVLGGGFAALRRLLNAASSQNSPSVANATTGTSTFVFAAAVATLVIVLGATTWVRNLAYSDALGMWRQVAAYRSNPRAHLSIGYLLGQQGRFDEAEKCYREALRMNDGLAEAQNNLGHILHRRGQIDEAIVCYRKAIAAWGGFADAHRNLGWALLQKGMVAQAEEELHKAIEVRPLSAAGYESLAQAYENWGRQNDAMEQYARAIELRPSLVSLLGMGRLYAARDDLPEAVRYLRRAVNLDANSADAQAELGAALARQQRYAEAREPLERAAALRPTSAREHLRLGDTLASLGDQAGAILHLRRATELDDRMGSAHFRLGFIYQRLGDDGQAITCFRNAIRVTPKFAPAYHGLGLALESQGRLDEAVEAYNQALKVSPDFAEAKDALQKALAKQGLSTRPGQGRNALPNTGPEENRKK